jgi:hypothetical protein
VPRRDVSPEDVAPELSGRRRSAQPHAGAAAALRRCSAVATSQRVWHYPIRGCPHARTDRPRRPHPAVGTSPSPHSYVHVGADARYEVDTGADRARSPGHVQAHQLGDEPHARWSSVQPAGCPRPPHRRGGRQRTSQRLRARAGRLHVGRHPAAGTTRAPAALAGPRAVRSVRPGVPTVVMSAFSERVGQVPAGTEILRKPFTAETLLDALRSRCPGDDRGVTG